MINCAIDVLIIAVALCNEIKYLCTCLICLLGKSDIACSNPTPALEFQINKMFLPRSLAKIQTARARISHPLSGGQCYLIHLTILRRFSCPCLAYMFTKVAHVFHFGTCHYLHSYLCIPCATSCAHL